jgi:hypothetical protein
MQYLQLHMPLETLIGNLCSLEMSIPYFLGSLNPITNAGLHWIRLVFVGPIVKMLPITYSYSISKLYM